MFWVSPPLHSQEGKDENPLCNFEQHIGSMFVKSAKRPIFETLYSRPVRSGLP
jgi:hypothetical protein